MTFAADRQLVAMNLRTYIRHALPWAKQRKAKCARDAAITNRETETTRPVAAQSVVDLFHEFVEVAF
jgi:hypothetical protein